MHEAIVPAAIDLAVFDSCMLRIETSPVSAEMREVPVFVDEAILLLFRHFEIEELVDDTVVEYNRVLDASQY